MKNRLLILLMLVALISFKCKTNYKEAQIRGKWYITEVQYLPTGQLSNVATDSCFYVNFYEDHKIWMRFMTSASGGWDINSNKLQIHLSEDINDVYYIEYLSEDTLIFINDAKRLKYTSIKSKPCGCL
jgi:hypothetical protein